MLHLLPWKTRKRACFESHVKMQERKRSMQEEKNPSGDSLTASTPCVLVVGAGPVGLTLAGDLLRRSIRCRLIDQAAADTTVQQTKAVGIQAKTLELLAR